MTNEELINEKLDLILTILRQKLELSRVDGRKIKQLKRKSQEEIEDEVFLGNLKDGVLVEDLQPEVPSIDNPPEPGPEYAVWKNKHWNELLAREIAEMPEDPPGLDDVYVEQSPKQPKPKIIPNPHSRRRRR